MNILLAGVFAVLLSSVQCGPFTVSISVQDEHKIGDDVVLDVTITNNHDKDYALLTRNTPLEGIKSNMFSVTRDGKVIPYDSILVRRSASPSAEEYVFIQAGTSLSASVDLSQAYSFDSPGEYKVQLQTELQYLNDEKESQKVTSNIEVLSFADSPNAPKLTDGELHRRSTTKTVIKDADAAIPNVVFDGPDVTRGLKSNAETNYLRSFYSIIDSYFASREDPALYQRWFGEITPTNVENVQDVQDVFYDMWAAMYYETITLYFWGPECEENWYGYTYTNSRVIYLCEKLWNRIPDVGVDGKVDTLVHELSHAIAETDDIAYGVPDCLELAEKSPDEAIINAENYCYFAREVVE